MAYETCVGDAAPGLNPNQNVAQDVAEGGMTVVYGAPFVDHAVETAEGAVAGAGVSVPLILAGLGAAGAVGLLLWKKYGGKKGKPRSNPGRKKRSRARPKRRRAKGRRR